MRAVALQITSSINTDLDASIPRTPHPINAAQSKKRLQREEVARGSRPLIEKSFAANGTAQTGNAVITVPFSFEFVIVRELLVCRKSQHVLDLQWASSRTSFDVPERVDHDAFAAIYLDDLCGTVGRAAVVDEPGDATPLGGVDHGVLVDSE